MKSKIQNLNFISDQDSGLVNQGESNLPPDAEEDSSHEGGEGKRNAEYFICL